jgi:FRG domain
MPWKKRRVKSLEAFVGALEGLLPSTATDDQVYWFRGQRDVEWGLEPSLLRDRRDTTPPDDIRNIEDLALRIFRPQAHMFVSPPLLAKVWTTPCWWALMQHHGAPTRLLDWSASPYVAAYFAVLDQSAKDGVVWCFCANRLRKAAELICGVPPPFEDKAAPCWYDAALKKYSMAEVVMPLEFNFASSERCAAQQGKFTMAFQVDAPHDELIGQAASVYTQKIIIPYAQKAKFLLRLREMNITGAALFPGVDGLGQSVKELVSLGTLCRRLHLQDGQAQARTAAAGTL